MEVNVEQDISLSELRHESVQSIYTSGDPTCEGLRSHKDDTFNMVTLKNGLVIQMCSGSTMEGGPLQ